MIEQPPKLVLASASASRRRLLTAAGIAFEAVVSEFVEEWQPTDEPAATVLALARGKANRVAAGHRDAYVLGCDSLFVIDGTLLGKPTSEAEATARWRTMAGREGVLYTGHALVHGGELHDEVVATTVGFATPTDDELAAYVSTRESIGVAGGFTLEGRSSAFIDHIDGDPSNVLGLSVAALRRLLLRFGVPISTIWA